MNETTRIASAHPTQRAAAILSQLFDRVFFGRVSLAIVTVLLCFQFEWHALRFLTSEVALQITAALGLPIQRIAFDELKFRDTIIQFTVTCTWIDGLFGILPLLRMHGARRVNLQRAAIFILGFFLLNVVRIEIVILLYKPGISWDLEHGWITGISEFLVYLWVVSLIDHPLARFLRSGNLPRAIAPQLRERRFKPHFTVDGTLVEALASRSAPRRLAPVLPEREGETPASLQQPNDPSSCSSKSQFLAQSFISLGH